MYSFKDKIGVVVENSIYTDKAGRDAIMADKKRVAELFTNNFLAIIGMFNATAKASSKQKLREYIKSDKKLRIADISDENNDMTIAIKMAKESGFFKGDEVVNQITRFLAKVKTSNIDKIDSTIVAGWLDKMTPTYFNNIPGRELKQTVKDFAADGGKTIDISRITVKARERRFRVLVPSDFNTVAKGMRFKEAIITPSTATAPTPTPTVDPVVDTPMTVADIDADRNKLIAEIEQFVDSPSSPSDLQKAVSTIDTIIYDAADTVNKSLEKLMKPVATDINDLKNKYAPGLDVAMKDLEPYLQVATDEQTKVIFNGCVTRTVRTGVLFKRIVARLLIDSHVPREYKVILPTYMYAACILENTGEFYMKHDVNKMLSDFRYLNSWSRKLDFYDIWSFLDMYKHGDVNVKNLDQTTIRAFLSIVDMLNVPTHVRHGAFEAWKEFVTKHVLDEEIVKRLVSNDNLESLAWLTTKSSVLEILQPYLTPIRGDEKWFDGLTFSQITRKGSLFPVDKSAPDTYGSLAFVKMAGRDAKYDHGDVTEEEIDKAIDFALKNEIVQPYHIAGVLTNYSSGSTHRKNVFKALINHPKVPNDGLFGTLTHRLGNMDGSDVVDVLRTMKENNINMFSVERYKGLERSSKSVLTDLLTAVMNDALGTDIEDYISDIIEEFPTQVKQKIRKSVVGVDVIRGEITNSEIELFGQIDDKRMKEILLYNDIDIEHILRDSIPRKSKKETFTQFIKRAKESVHDDPRIKEIIVDPKVSIDNETDVDQLTADINRNYHAGKHGDVYPKVEKVYNSSLEYPEFEEFRNNAPGGKDTVVPAFHGSGGIASSMILRYGYTVIKSTDSSVVGRMLGDGIYFSNKIDKVSQYIGNKGYSRHSGTRGYIFHIDVNLGVRPKDYNAAGIKPGDNIRSPEWVVRDPKAQIRIKKVYQCVIRRRNEIKDILNEESGFRGYLTEAMKLKMSNNKTTDFIFRDGMIPIPYKGRFEYVDFEVALKEGYIKQENFTPTSQGPMITFDDAKEDARYDMRSGAQLTGRGLREYEEYFHRDFGVAKL